MKKISVIIPCYNATKWLPKCFVSLSEQTIGVDDIEMIFVNDASTDDGRTWSMLCEIERAFPESVIIIDLQTNMRQGGARNEALKYASGEYIAFLDADDYIEPNLCERTYELAVSNDADIVQFNYKLFFEEKNICIDNPAKLKDEIIDIKSDDERKSFLMQEKLTYGCWNKIYRRSMVAESGVKYAEHCIYEEPLFVYPLLFYANKIVTTNEHLYVYRQNNLGTMRNDMKERDTLKQHSNVQLAVWNFMKNTIFFDKFYEEIKAYFLHTYLYEYLEFSAKRDMELDYESFCKISSIALSEVDTIVLDKYNNIFVKQNRLYEMINNGLSFEKLQEYYMQLK